MRTFGTANHQATAANPFEIDMWTLHSGATYALTHFFSGKEGVALDEIVRTPTDILFNPEGVIDRVKGAYERGVEEMKTGDGQTSLERHVRLAQIGRVGSDVREKAKTFRERERAIRGRLGESGN